MTHWHVGTGLTGYGADSESLATAEEPRELADLAQGELQRWAESEQEAAEFFGIQEMYKEAWLLQKHAEGLASLAQNLDNGRAVAPLFKDNPAAWDETVLKLVAAHFPNDVDEGRSRIYAWECEIADEACQALKEVRDAAG